MYFILGLCILFVYLILKKKRNRNVPGNPRNRPSVSKITPGKKAAIEKELFRECYISVGEPWNFTGPDGDNLVIGKLIKIVTPDCAIFQSNHQIEVDGIKGNIFFLFTRHSNYDIYTSFQEINSWTCNIGLYTGNDASYLNMSREQLEKNSKYVLIGGLHCISSLSKHFRK